MTPGGGRGWFHRKRPHQNEPTDSPNSAADGMTAPQPTGDSTSHTPEYAPVIAAGGETPGATDWALAEPSLISEARQPEQATPSGIDWDAATAAALSDDAVGGFDASPHAVEHEHGPDRLLEDLIREIVGDAAVDTATALQTAPVVVQPYEESVPRLEGANVVAPDLPSERLPEDPHVGAFPDQGSVPSPAHDGDSAHLSGETTALAAPTAAQPGEATSFVEPQRISPASPEQNTMDPAPALVVSPTAAPDVSRETSIDHGGTPLAYELADETRRRIALEESVLPLPPATRVLTISNQKGGVGKTTTAVNLAAALARSGAKVLVIDLDPQGNASTALGVDHRSEQKSVYEVLVADLPLAEVIRPSTEHEQLDCVPATIHLAGAEIELVSLVAREQRLRRALDTHLATMERPYDYVFIDCPPSLGLLTINAFVAAREVLIPIQCEYYALEGLSQLLSNIELIEKHLNPELRLSTILLTMYDSRTNLAQQVAQEVRDHFPVQTLQTIIPRSVRVSEAPSYGQSVISYDFASTGSLSYREAAAEIARRGAATPEESN